MKKRVGDTLIEVALAIGIFSMVAIAVVAVMNGGTSSAQTALEATLAREEVDIQAEALRFIQSAYIADNTDNSTNKATTEYEKIWEKINNRAITTEGQHNYLKSIIENTSSCNSVYDDENENDNNFFKNHAFIINPNTMELITPDDNSHNIIFSPASTYPRLIKNSQIEGTDVLSDQLVTNSLSSDLSRVEGLYVIAAKDAGSTVITHADNTSTKKDSAFLDFYIRACWYGAGDESSSNVSTVIRLYNPDATTVASSYTGVWVEYKNNGGEGDISDEFVDAGKSINLSSGNKFTRDGWTLVGWSTHPNTKPSQIGEKGTYRLSESYTAPTGKAFNDKLTLYAIWQTEYFLAYNTNYASWSIGNTDCDKNNGCNISSSSAPSRSGLKFKGWCAGTISSNKCNGTLYQPGNHYPGVMSQKVIQLYALWVPWYQVLYYNTNGTTQLCMQEGESSSFTVECNKTPTNPGHGEEFQGWSPNDREPFYVNGNKVTVANTGARTLKLYPVWRVSVNFSSEGWVPSSTGNSERSCYIFNYAKPTEENCPSRTCRYSEVKAGASYGDYTNKAPADGYKVINGGNHIEVLDEGIINLQGYCSRSANESVSYTIGKNDTFELSANMNTAGIRTHPSGYASISIGPITATIEEKRITSKCNSSAGGSYNYTNGNAINLKIEKHGNDYSISANGTVLKSCNVNTTGNVTVEYSMVHNSHNCDRLFNVQLVDIKMRRYIKN